jgi:hypothetical protein
MADRNGLKLVGFIFATVTVAVMLTAAMMVKGYAEGSYSFDAAPIASSSESERRHGLSAAPDQGEHHDRRDQ